MKFRVKRIKDCKHQLRAEVGDPKLEERFQEVFKTIQRKATLRGYRQGKAPMNLIEAAYKDDAHNEVMRSMIEELYRTGLKQSKLTPVGHPSIDEVKLERGKQLSFKAEFECFPQFSLKKTKGFKISKPVIHVLDDEVDKALNSLRDTRAEIRPLAVPRPVEKGDVVRCDVEECVQGVYQEPQKGVHLSLDDTLRNKSIISVLMGASLDESRIVYADDSAADKTGGLAGQEPKLRITIREIKVKKLPELSDVFARQFGQKDAAGLRDAIGKDIAKYQEIQAKEKISQELFDQLLSQNKFVVPEHLVEEEKKGIVERLKERGGAVGEGDEGKAAEKAERQVRLFFILEKIAEELKIEPTQEEISTKLSEVVQQTGKPIDEVIKQYGDSIWGGVRRQKTVDRMLQDCQS